MLQADRVDDFILATGQLHSVRDWVEACFSAAGLDWTAHVRQDPKLIPAIEPAAPCGDPSKARAVLNWRPTVDFRTMAARMVEHALNLESPKQQHTT